MKKHYLGVLCKRNHRYKTTNMSLRYVSTGNCVQCLRGRPVDPVKARESSIRSYWRNRKANLERMRRYSKTDSYKESQRKHRQRNRDKLLAKTREWRTRNKKYISSYNRDYSQINRKKINAKRAIWAEKNKEILIEKRKQSRLKNIESIKRLQKVWRESARGKLIRAYHQRRRNLAKKGLKTEYTSEELIAYFGKFHGCAYCLIRVKTLTIDHFIPICRGGADALHNVVPACFSCNMSKARQEPVEWFKRQKFYKPSSLQRMLRLMDKNRKGEVNV